MPCSIQRLSFLHAWLLGVGLAVSGCSAARVEQMNNEVKALREELDELKRSQAAQRVQFDEFRNRMVLIEDRAETEKLARGRRDETWVPNLQTVKVEKPTTPEANLGQQDDSQEPSGPGGDLPPQLKDPAAPRVDPALVIYNQAKNLLDHGQLPAARGMFESLLKQYPDHDLADNALYWIGESWYAQALWLRAAQSFLRVAQLYPRANKVPDALLKLGLTYRQMGDDKAAADVLRQLTRTYPNTQAAHLAQERLDDTKRSEP